MQLRSLPIASAIGEAFSPLETKGLALHGRVDRALGVAAPWYYYYVEPFA
jgi:hypothetical protein